MLRTVRIGVDTRAAFLDPHRGFGRFTRALVDALLGVDGHEVVLFVPHRAGIPQPWYSRAAAVVQLTRPRRPAFLFDPPAWAFALRRHRVDVLHIPAWGVPRGLPLPVVATFYDATPFRFASPPERWRRHRARMAIRSLRRATRVHAISHYAKSELLDAVALPGADVSVVHLAADRGFAPAATPGQPRHFLYVGGADPHKNLALLLEAFSRQEAAALPPLVIAGPAAADVHTRASTAAARVRVVSHPSDAELVALYRDAVALLFPSRNEGFGLPALEAMACGCPVVAARSGALPEVCGDAAVLLEPDDVSAWSATLVALASDPGRRAALAAAGLARSHSFSWEATAQGMIGIYRAAARLESA